jgi:hypothetical protein
VQRTADVGRDGDACTRETQGCSGGDEARGVLTLRKPVAAPSVRNQIQMRSLLSRSILRELIRKLRNDLPRQGERCWVVIV